MVVAIGDYGAEPTVFNITFGPTVNYVSNRISIVNDNIEEDTEMFGLVLTVKTEGAVVTRSQPEIANVIIKDDDRKCNF